MSTRDSLSQHCTTRLDCRIYCLFTLSRFRSYFYRKNRHNVIYFVPAGSDTHNVPRYASDLEHCTRRQCRRVIFPFQKILLQKVQKYTYYILYEVTSLISKAAKPFRAARNILLQTARNKFHSHWQNKTELGKIKHTLKWIHFCYNTSRQDEFWLW